MSDAQRDARVQIAAKLQKANAAVGQAIQIGLRGAVATPELLALPQVVFSVGEHFIQAAKEEVEG